VSASGGVAMDSAGVYVTDDEGVVRAYARADGKPLWTQSALRWRRLGTPLVRRGFLLVGDADGMLHALQRADGKLAARLETGRGALLADGVASGELTLYQAQRGGVVAIDID
jgi:outer membrane protein assembly factor BamB